MSELSIELHWQRPKTDPHGARHSYAHTVRYNDNFELQVDAAPGWGGDPHNTNPEQALAAAISSCHMMTFLALAAKAKWPVASIRDRAVAHLGKNSKGRMSVTRVDLHPLVDFDSGFSVGAAEMEEMQQRAHRYCFIANSLADSVEIKILQQPAKTRNDEMQQYSDTRPG